MKDIDLTGLLIRDHTRENKINRFNSSEVWAICNGYVSAKQYLAGKKNTMEDIKKMWRGTIKHKAIEKYLQELGWETEVKTERSFPTFNGDWTLVGKADGVKLDEVLELKTSDKIILAAKSWHEFQARLYCHLFNKRVGGIYQPIFSGEKFILRLIGEVNPNDAWFAGVINYLNDFHNKLIKLQ